MKEKLFLIIDLILILLFGVIIVINISKKQNTIVSNTTNQIETEANNSTLTIKLFKENLIKNGFTISNEIQKAAELIGANEGYGFEIDGSTIEIYNFNLNSEDSLTKSNINSAINEGKVYMPSLNNYSINAKINKNLVLVSFDAHPDKDKIIKIFNEL